MLIGVTNEETGKDVLESRGTFAWFMLCCSNGTRRVKKYRREEINGPDAHKAKCQVRILCTAETDYTSLNRQKG